MDFYDSRYFSINKFLCQCCGIWPYDSRRKYICRILILTMLAAFSVPHWIGMYVNFSDTDRLMEHICLGLFLMILTSKYLTVILAQDKMEIMFDNIIVNWESINDEEERNILIKYSERGRLLTIGYLAYILNVGVLFVFLPLMPFIINKMRPESEPLPRLFLMNAEFLVDRNQHYWKIYFWDLTTTFVGGIIVVVCDTTFAACVEHCVGLFAIIRHRLRSPGGFVHSKPIEAKNGDASYKRIVEIVKLHQDSLSCADTLEASYSFCFLIIMTTNLVLVPLICVMIIMNENQPIQVFRFFVLFTGTSLHLFYLSYAGQRIIDSSSHLFEDGYHNEWYEGSKQTKMAISYFMLRCTSPAMITAGGIMIMGMETFLKIMKTALSYITVLASFR